MERGRDETPIAKLLRRLDVVRIGDNIFEGGSGLAGATVGTRIFGGLLLGQAVTATARALPALDLHSFSATFIHPGQVDTPMRYEVEIEPPGRIFRTAQAVAVQDLEDRGSTVMARFSASFSGPPPPDTARHQSEPRTVPPPEDCPNRDEVRGRPHPERQPFDIRLCQPLPTGPTDPHQAAWFRPRGAMPGDRALHWSALAFMTDRMLLGTAVLPHSDRGEMNGVSLDHSIWFHAPVDLDQWHLQAMESPVAAMGRGLALASVTTQAGVRVATTAQEGLVRFA